MNSTKLVAGSVIAVIALSIAGPASAYRGQPRTTDINLKLSSTRVTQGDPVTGRVGLSWATTESSGKFEECEIYFWGACFPGSGRLSYKIGEDKGESIDWLEDGKIKALGDFEIPFSPNRVGVDHPYVLRMRFRDAFGGPVFYGSTAKKTFYVYP